MVSASVVVVVAVDHRLPQPVPTITCDLLLFAFRFLADPVAYLVCVPQTDRSMLRDSKEKVAAERDLLDVLWSYCMMEQAAGCVLLRSC